MAYLRHGNRRVPVRVLLDSGSQVSLVREGVLPKCKDGYDAMQDFSLTVVGGTSMTKTLRVMDCVIESMDGEVKRDIRLTELKHPCGNSPVVKSEQLSKYPHLRDVNIEEQGEVIDTLLGVDNTDLMIPHRYIRGSKPGDPIAAQCLLGWFILGNHGPATDGDSMINYLQVSKLEEFLGVEEMGLNPRRCFCNKDDKDATVLMEKSVTQLDNGTYQVSLPWIKSPEKLPDNYDYAAKRFFCLEKQFVNRPSDWSAYSRQMSDQLDRGVARLVTQDELDNDRKEGRKMWFLPHFAVKKESTTTPVRVVYDGKARYQGHSPE